MKQQDMHSIISTHPSKQYLFVKRMMDIILSSLMLILLTPVILFVSFLLYLYDGPPVIFKQTRVGAEGKTFILRKFRTLKQYKIHSFKERKQYQRNWLHGVPDNFVFKSSCPEEATKLGKFLRKYSIDELPQLINVLKGEMSLIGPRPEVSEITDYYNVEQRQRLLVKPGLTGYAQVNGRSGINHGEKIRCDLYYIEHMTLKLDLFILLQTIKHVINPTDSF